MKLVKIVRTTYVLDDEQDDEQADYWDYFNRSEAMLYQDSVLKTPVDPSEVPEYVADFFNGISEDDV